MVIGLRDNNGIVNRLSPLYISDIEQKAVNFLVYNSSIDLYPFRISRRHGLLNHSSISFYFLLIFLNNMWQMNIHLIISKFLLYIKSLNWKILFFWRDVFLFHFVPSTQKITAEKSSDPKYHFLPDWFFNGFI